MNGLVRSRDNKMIAGVSSALAERFNLSITAVRALFVLSGLLHGMGVFAYLLLWLVIPVGPASIEETS